MTRVSLYFAVLLAILSPTSGRALQISAEPEGATLTNSSIHLKIEISELDQSADTAEIDILVDGILLQRLSLAAGEHRVTLKQANLSLGRHTLRIESGDTVKTIELRAMFGWLSLLPPVIAIGLALAFKDVVFSLFFGVFAGALLLNHWNPIVAFARSIDQFIAPALADSDHASIIIFSALLGGMVGVITKSGGTQGIVERLKTFASTARRGQLATWTLGVVVFFDDYANTLIVGSTMRSITDRLRISREKLAYIVDSTAAPVASIAPISTWIGFEIGLIAAAFDQLELPFNAYGTLIASIPFRFYPLFALVLGFTIASTCRDFGPMLKAELRASRTGKVLNDGDKPLADYDAPSIAPPENTPLRAVNALLPILTVVLVTLAGLYVSGREGMIRSDYSSSFLWLRDVFSNANSFHALLWASLAGVTVAIMLALGQRILTLKQSLEAAVGGFKSMLLCFIVLILAWSIGGVSGELHTADFIVGLTSGILQPRWLPVLVFAMSAAISFATGASWGTMAILMPLAIPICHELALSAGHPVTSESYYTYLLGTISSVLAGSVWGDHCSPISDTTILSSMASSSDHIAHVRTQMPYALAIGFLGMVVGDIPTAMGVSPWIALLLGAAVIVIVVRWLGTRSDWQPTESILKES
ncbi:MAG: Na+/H+ antiporter NhaC family protein [Thermoanaerobaculia bacterium]